MSRSSASRAASFLALCRAFGTLFFPLLLGPLIGPGVSDAFSLGRPEGRPAILDSTWTLHLHAHGDNENARDDDDDYGDLLSIYNLRAGLADHTLSLRFDALRFLDPPSGAAIRDSNSADYADEYVLEKLSWTWRGQGLSLSAGDQYVTFGRGLALSLRKVEELGVDTTLRGGRAELSTRYLRATLVGGWTNAGNFDPISERLRFASCTPTYGGEEFSCNPLRIGPADPILGARVEGRWPGVLHLGLEEVQLSLEQQDGSAQESWLHGVSLELPGLPLDLGELFVEGVLLDRGGSPDDRGLGIYAALALYLGPLSLLVEGKHGLGRAPSDELSEQEINDLVEFVLSL